MFNALITGFAVMVSPKDQPATLGLNTSMTTANYKNPAQVGM
jgi:hypothetical protein